MSPMTNDKDRKKAGVPVEAALKGGRKRVLYDAANMRSAYANVADVTGGREEISIRFGITQEGHTAGKEIRARVTDRIILSPFAAKRLFILLDHAMRDYESRYGSLAEGPSPSPAPFFSKPERVDEKAGLLFQLTKDLDVQIGIERSFKMFRRTLLANRFLLGFKQTEIQGNPHKRILDICERIDMPGKYLEIFRQNLPEANIVLFGFEENEETSLYKAYLEFGGRFEKVIGDNPDRPAPFLIHLGFKWDSSDNSRGAVARYTCFPSFSVEDMRERLSTNFYGRKDVIPFEISKGILDLASGRMGPDKFLYLEVNEEGNPRRSFDINMYRAGLRLKDLSPLLLEMCRHYSIPFEAFHLLYEPVKTQFFGHLSGGFDRQGRDFFTIYFGVKGSSG